MKTQIVLMALCTILSSEAQDSYTFAPNKLPFGDPTALENFLLERATAYRITLTESEHGDPNLPLDWNYAFPTIQRSYSSNHPFADQVFEQVRQMASNVVTLDPTRYYALGWYSVGKLAGTDRNVVDFHTQTEDQVIFQIVRNSDGTYSVPSTVTNVVIKPASHLVLAHFPGLVWGRMEFTNAGGTSVFDTRNPDEHWFITRWREDNSPGLPPIPAMLVINRDIITGGHAGILRVVYHNGAVTDTYSTQDGELLNREISLPEMKVRPIHDGLEDQKVEIEIVSAPGTIVELEGSSTMSNWKVLKTVTVPSFGSAFIRPECPEAFCFYRVKLVGGYSGMSIKSVKN